MTTATEAPRRWTIVLAAALAAVILAGTGFLIGTWVVGPERPGTDSAEAGFARDMSEHHAQAVELSMIAYGDATMPDVRRLAADIALTQQSQIGTMQEWLREWQLLPTGDKPPMAWMPGGDSLLGPGALMPGMATRAEVAKLREATGRDVDVLFCQLMLRHHLGGIHMIDGVLANSDNAKVTELADRMRVGQSAEVQVLQSFLKTLNAAPL